MNMPTQVVAEALAKANEEIILLRQQLKEALAIIDEIHGSILEDDERIPGDDQTPH